MATWLLVIALPLAILDLVASRARRRAWAQRLAPRGTELPTVRSSIAYAAAQTRRRLAGGADRSLFGLRPLAVGLLTSFAAGFGILALGTAAVGAADVLAHALRYFAAPAIVIAVLALVACYTIISAAEQARSVVTSWGLVVLLVVLGVLAWLGLMHAGTWLAWQTKRSPIAWGSEWFYAEAYLTYLREPAGRMISIAAAVVVAGVGLWWLGQVVLAVAAVAARRLGRAALWHLPRGVLAVAIGALVWMILSGTRG